MNDDEPLISSRRHDTQGMHHRPCLTNAILAMDDEKRTYSIVNLQAILNIDDMDVVIKLLQENNWDESVRRASVTFLVSGICPLCATNASRIDRLAKGAQAVKRRP